LSGSRNICPCDLFVDALKKKENRMDGGGIAARLRAARVSGPGKVDMVDRPLPTPGQGEVRVRLEGCGVCASNLGPWSGPDWMEFPLEPGELGHEGWGRIDAIGQGVPTARLEERVAILGLRSYASHDVVSADAALPLPPGLADKPVPAEALGCAVSIFRLAAIGPGDRVAIIGIGFIGALLTSLAAAAGAEVLAISRREESLRLAESLGAARTIPMLDHGEIVSRVGDITGGTGVDICLECAGHQWPLDLAAEITRESGRLVIAGYHQDGPRQVNMQLWNWRAFDIVNAHVRDEAAVLGAMREAISLAAEGRLPVKSLLTHEFPLERLGAALDTTRDKPDGFVKAWVSMP
jgi:NADPH:quinone reductase